MLPESFELVETAMKNDAHFKSHVMTLRISKGGIESFSGLPIGSFSGNQAEWIVYVRCKATNDIYQMVLEKRLSYTGASVERVFTQAVSKFELGLQNNGSAIKAEIEDEDITLSVNIPLYVSS